MTTRVGHLLDEMLTRLQRKKHLWPFMMGWERRIGIVTEDTQSRWQLVFSKEGSMMYQEWNGSEQPDLVLRGMEQEIGMLLEGDEMRYVIAKQKVKMTGTCRDQLKLDALFRLTCK